MKLAIISDIHGNKEALQEVIRHAEAEGVEQFACLGDIVGYGPNPAECISIIQSLSCAVVKGNHDHAASNDDVLENLHPDAQASLEWTRKQLTDSHKRWLGALPLIRRVGRITIAHASPHRPNAWTYISSHASAHDAMTGDDRSICFIGHTHFPAAFEHIEGKTHEIGLDYFTLQSNSRYLINAGSVGQPRDGDNRACYAVYNRSENSVRYHRVKYDVSTTRDSLRNHNLPESLCERLIKAA